MTVLGNPSRPRGVSKEMKVWASFAMVACLLVLASDTAEAKYVSETLTIDGPGMDSPGIIESRAAIDRVYAATLVGKQRARIARPAEPGPAYLLEFGFGVGDEDGARTETVGQVLYPFAQGGPAVLTPRGQGFDMSYGAVRFRPGWYAVPSEVLRILVRRGLPRALPRSELARNASTRADSEASRPPRAGIAAMIVGALVLFVGAWRRLAFQPRGAR